MSADVDVRAAPTRRSFAAPLLLVAIVAYPLYPKLSLLAVPGTYIPVRIDDIITAILVAAWGIELLRERRLPLFPFAITATAGLWMLSALISLVVGVLILRSIPAATGFGFWAKPLEYLLLGLIGFDLVRNGAVTVRAVLAAVFGGAAVVIGYGVPERLGIVDSFPGSTPIPGVIISTIGDPHELASYVGLIVLLGVAIWPRLSRNLRIVASLGLIPAAFVMFNSGARSEYLTLAAVLVGLAIWRPTRALRRPAIAAVAVLGIILVSPAAIGTAQSLGSPAVSPLPTGRGSTPPPEAPNVASRLGDRTLSSSLHTRFAVKWPAFLRATAADPIFGLGPSAATEAADGYYIRALLEFGIVGTLLFLGLLLSIWRALRRAVATETGVSRDLAVGLLAGTAFVFVVGILIDTWVASRVMELYWPLLGVGLGVAAAQPAVRRVPELALA